MSEAVGVVQLGMLGRRDRAPRKRCDLCFGQGGYGDAMMGWMPCSACRPRRWAAWLDRNPMVKEMVEAYDEEDDRP